MTDSLFAQGQCLCGNVHYSVSSAPSLMVQCHCKDCQTSSGTGHTSNTFFREGDVTVNLKQPLSEFTVTTDSGNQLTRRFCPICGSRAHGTNTGREGMINLPVGMFEDHSWYAPRAVVYTKHRQAWDITASDIPNFEAMPPTK